MLFMVDLFFPCLLNFSHLTGLGKCDLFPNTVGKRVHCQNSSLPQSDKMILARNSIRVQAFMSVKTSTYLEITFHNNPESRM
jgi:hypothetical protein